MLNWVSAPDVGQSLNASIDIGYKERSEELYLEIGQYGDNGEIDYEIEVEFLELDDVFERNDLFTQAQWIEVDKEVTGYIFPRGDRERHCLGIPQPGQVVVTLSSPDPAIRPSLRLVSPDNYTRVNWTSAEDFGKSVSNQMDILEPGLLFVEAQYYGDERRSTQAYTTKSTWTPVVDESEPNNDLSQRTFISLGEMVSAHIFPVGDRDWYEIGTEKMGFLHIEVSSKDSAMLMGLRVVSEALANWIYTENSLDKLNTTIQALPGKCVFEIAQRGDNRRSTLPYQVQVSLEEVVDTFEPNNRFFQAAPITVGVPVQGTIFPTGDRDWYSYTLFAESEVSIETIGDSPLQMETTILQFTGPMPPKPGRRQRFKGSWERVLISSRLRTTMIALLEGSHIH
ncbi:MAG: hypothetical protein PHV61_03955 [Limnochordia bacterium]|nr:hypothetical protein [Limnochordia bacterium]MDD4517591.1 hypothetical protein [Limnochordia bacterium]